jgi:hypothetical protein
MKKLFFASLFLFGIFTTVQAQSDEKQPTAMNQTTAEKLPMPHTDAIVSQDYQELSIADLPQLIKQAVAKAYEESTITQAYKNQKGEFKLILSSDSDSESLDEASQTVYVNSKGEFIK